MTALKSSDSFIQLERLDSHDDERLPQWQRTRKPRTRPKSSVVLICGLALITLLFYHSWTSSQPQESGELGQEQIALPEPIAETSNWCPLSEPTSPPDDGLTDSRNLFSGEDVLKLQVERLSAAVNISTVSYDNNGDVDEDTRWRTFGQLHEVLRELFPLIAQQVEIQTINKYGLLCHLGGSDRSLKPILLMAHQDVVPPMDPNQWTYPPFEAHFDGGWLWGRGSADCKSNLIGILSAIEALLSQDFEPKRTIILAFGFDEETGGERGAKRIAAALQRNMGNDSLAMILDEGGMGVSTLGDVAYALPAVAEKGFVDIILSLETDGGHSSRPPDRTAIGIMSQVISALEDHPFEPVLDHNNPVRGVLKCEAEHSPTHVEPWLRDELSTGEDFGQRIADARGGSIRWQIQTSQAVDIIRGGDKDNQLPSKVEVTVNYRIAPHEDVEELFRSIAERVASVVHQYDIPVAGLGLDEEPRSKRIMRLQTKDLLAPSPITPTDQNSEVWAVFSGTLRQVFESVDTLGDTEEVVPVGSIATGNSDTAHYWNLTRNIFRFTPAREGSRQGIHDIDERMQMSAHLEMIRVYYDLIRNMQSLEGFRCDGSCPAAM